VCSSSGWVKLIDCITDAQSIVCGNRKKYSPLRAGVVVILDSKTAAGFFIYFNVAVFDCVPPPVAFNLATLDCC
jgi:hypothetical protein